MGCGQNGIKTHFHNGTARDVMLSKRSTDTYIPTRSPTTPCRQALLTMITPTDMPLDCEGVTPSYISRQSDNKPPLSRSVDCQSRIIAQQQSGDERDQRRAHNYANTNTHIIGRA